MIILLHILVYHFQVALCVMTNRLPNVATLEKGLDPNQLVLSLSAVSLFPLFPSHTFSTCLDDAAVSFHYEEVPLSLVSSLL